MKTDSVHFFALRSIRSEMKSVDEYLKGYIKRWDEEFVFSAFMRRNEKKYGKNSAVFFCRTVTELHINYKSYTSYAAQSFLSSVVSHKTLKLKCVVTWLRTKMLVENTSSDRERAQRSKKKHNRTRRMWLTFENKSKWKLCTQTWQLKNA